MGRREISRPLRNLSVWPGYESLTNLKWRLMGTRLDQRSQMTVGGGVKLTVSNLLSRPHRVSPLQENLIASGSVLGCFALLIIAILVGIIPYFTLLSAVLGIAGGAFGLLRVGKNTDTLHPVRLFGTIWCLCLALASLRLTTNMTVWPASVWVSMISALCTFVSGFWLMSRRFVKSRPRQGFGPECDLPPSEMLDPRRGLKLAILCLLVGISALSYEYWLIGGIPVLSEDIDRARTTFFATAGRWTHPEFDTLFYKIVGILTLLCKYAVYLALIILIQKTKKSRAQLVATIVVILWGVLALASQGGRGLVFDIFIASGILFHYLRHCLRAKHLLPAGLLLFLFLSAAGYFRIAHGRQDVFHAGVERVSKLPNGAL